MSFGSTIGAIISSRSNRKALKKVSSGNLLEPSFEKTERKLKYLELSDEQLAPILKKIRNKKKRQNNIRSIVILGFCLIVAVAVVYIILG